MTVFSSIMEVLDRQLLFLQTPVIPCLLPVKCHPRTTSLCTASNKWALSRLQITKEAQVQKLLSWQIPLSSCLAIPNTRDDNCSLLSTCANWTWAVAVLDDLFDSKEILGNLDKAQDLRCKILRATQGYTSYDHYTIEHPMLVEFAKLMEEFKSQMPCSMFNRFVKTHQRWLAANVEQVRRQEMCEIPRSIEEYAEYRRYTILVEPFFVLVELCMDLELRDKDVTRLEPIYNAVLDYAFLLNDVMSFKHDFDQHHIFTAPFLLAKSHDDMQVVLEELADMVQDKEREFKKLRQMIVEGGEGALVKYVEALSYVLSGCYYWHHVSARYR